MKQFSYTVQDHMGIHARRLIALMGLNVLQGETVTVSVEGEREAEDCQVMQSFFQENL